MQKTFNPVISKLSFRLLKYFLLVILIMFSIAFYSINASRNLNEHNNETLNHIQTLQSLITSLDDTSIIAANYLANPTNDYFRQFEKKNKDILSYADKMYRLYPHNPLYRDIYVMVGSYYEEGISLLNRCTPDAPSYLYTKDKISLDNLRTHISSYIYEGISKELDLANLQINDTNLTLSHNTMNIYLFSIVCTFLCLLVAFEISTVFVKPIIQLNKQCALVANGDLTVRLAPTKPKDEIRALIASFNNMVENLLESKQQLMKQAKIGNQLQEERLKNAEMQNLLNRSELEFLLMQINPHFLYNTLNSISAMSMIEDAEKTKEMIDSLSGLLRSILSDMSQTISLSSEIQTIRHYLAIQKVRFQSKLTYDIRIDEKCMSLFIPAMILQPLVENAIVHGLENFNGVGKVVVTASMEDAALRLIVSDNGIGMSAETLAFLQDDTQTENTNTKRSIGISNVRKRLKLIYNQDVMEIASTPNQGTCITISISTSTAF